MRAVVARLCEVVLRVFSLTRRPGGLGRVARVLEIEAAVVAGDLSRRRRAAQERVQAAGRAAARLGLPAAARAARERGCGGLGRGVLRQPGRDAIVHAGREGRGRQLVGGVLRRHAASRLPRSAKRRDGFPDHARIKRAARSGSSARSSTSLTGCWSARAKCVGDAKAASRAVGARPVNAWIEVTP